LNSKDRTRIVCNERRRTLKEVKIVVWANNQPIDIWLRIPNNAKIVQKGPYNFEVEVEEFNDYCAYGYI